MTTKLVNKTSAILNESIHHIIQEKNLIDEIDTETVNVSVYQFDNLILTVVSEKDPSGHWYRELVSVKG